MGYLKIPNLYRDQKILNFKHVFCMEKIHGTSTHVGWKNGELRFFSGGAKHENFIKLFDEEYLSKTLREIFSPEQSITIYGEAYGGKMQGMKDTYGENLRFVAFDVKIDGRWLAVPQANKIVSNLGFEFVDWVETSTDIEELNAQRDRDSIQAIRNGMGEGKKREGIVIRPLFEVTLNNGERLITKHKRDDFRETKKKRKVGKDLEVLTRANEIADEWVTMGRLKNICSKLKEEELTIENTGKFVRLMVEDVLTEGKDEIEDSKEARKAISREAAKLWKSFVTPKL